MMFGYGEIEVLNLLFYSKEDNSGDCNIVHLMSGCCFFQNVFRRWTILQVAVI